MSDNLQALRRANPRNRPDFRGSIQQAERLARAQIAAAGQDATTLRDTFAPRRRLLGVSAAGVAVAAAAAVAIFLSVGSPGGGPGVENARAALKRAAKVTAASAERSGTASVRMTQDGRLWAYKVVRWNGDDVGIVDKSPGGPSSGLPLLVVNGMMYGHDPCCEGWVELGSPESIDPGSGTTPAEILAAIREDVGGVTLRRLTSGMTGLTVTRLRDGSTVYSGTIAAGALARETGFKEGQSIRVLPFGYVAHGAAADPDAALDATMTVGADGLLREVSVAWDPAWTYTVTYTGVGSTPALSAPGDARPLRRDMR